MELQTLSVNTRDKSGKGPARRTRVNKAVPAVLYGGGGQPVSLTINLRSFEQLLQSHHGDHAVLQLDFADNPSINSAALVKAIQRHPVSDAIVHADFLRIRLDELIQTSVAVKLVGRAVGLTEGGVIEHQLREIRIECVAINVPDEISVDVSLLDIGDTLHVSEIPALEGITFLSAGDRAVVSVIVPRVATADREAEAEAEALAAEALAAEEGEGAEAVAGEEAEKKEKE